MEIADVYLYDLYFHSVIKEKIINPTCYKVTLIDWIRGFRNNLRQIELQCQQKLRRKMWVVFV